MAKAELNVEIRENAGKGVARKLRAEGKVPAVVYGKGMEPTTISVEPKALEAAVNTDAGWNTLLTLKGAPAVDGKVVVLKDLELHPLRRDMVCADFHAIDLQEKGSFMVPVVTVGKSAGEKEGGSLQIIRKELEVICLPTAVPQAIEINVEALNIGDVVHIEDVAAPEGAELPHDVNFTVITVKGHKEEVEDTEEGEEGVEAAEEAAAE
ncbi:LSU ribosomal protein L25P [Malonomonas rubra DSM 5091]|uniref:Large ribosomal subunit protein bL25 n=1 Tax=Malonomonas rubra DSM 5091 TaxID=1122189 RepID=A0A1M6E3V7_MALRU|nr:50S ribosomal protein L25 [Malonomonas rubra]SHI80187.1 LSU ribosomal protein L25P [Malonomonas rubra DSM 5091]